MKVVIVDDEPIARRILREEMDLIPGVRVIGEAGNGKEALLKIRKLQPNLVFLDLQMPVMSGLEVARSLVGPTVPVIVIVTAFDLHAVEAFEGSEIDYLLKPVSETQLRTALERARQLLETPSEIVARAERIASVDETRIFREKTPLLETA
jgi:two-component system LytT family response regulator